MNRIALLCMLVGLVGLRAVAESPMERVRRHEPRMSYLDNGTIRLGIDLNLGGAVTWLSLSGTDQNLINSYDFGRQIQMSYYSGPVPFRVPGKQLDPHWTSIGWNPIQVGDAFGHSSKLLESRNDQKQMYVKCVPMHWPLDDMPGECTFECWFELEGAAVHARCRLVNNRPDHTQYPARDQELPAIYTNGPWYRLMTYTGDAPFTGGRLTQIIKKPGEGGVWSDWLATECWAALVDDNDFGLGIWSPGNTEFKGGFVGTPGKGGTHDGHTGYIAPDPREIIDWNITHEYQYDLVVGKLEAIRKYVYAHAARPAPPAWTFADGRHGWWYHNATDGGWPIRGALDMRPSNNDPQLIGPLGFWQAEAAPVLVIEAASHTARTDGMVFWRGLEDRGFTPEKHAEFQLKSDGEFHTYRIRLEGNAAWKGPIVQIRIDPVAAGGDGEWVRIKSIRFEGGH